MPLKSFNCSICGAKCPSAYLRHGHMSDRMKWLRRHYKRKHPREFARMYIKKIKTK